ncbi:WD repeat-containing protein 40A-B [Entamoeba marina]
MIHVIQQRNRNSKNICLRQNCQSIMESRIPNFYQAEVLSFPNTESDKIFASSWISERTVAIGSKDNRLVLWDVFKNTTTNVKLPNVVANYDRGSGIHDVDFFPVGCYGKLICGSDSPNDVAVFDTKTLSPVALLKGHSDWVFGSKFIDANTIISGGRDGNLSFWRIEDYERTNNQKLHVVSPILTQCDPDIKIRCVGVNKTKQECYSLTSEGTIGIWDAETLTHLRDEQLDDMYELVAMDVKQEDNLIAVGSRSFTTVMDPRNSQEVIIIGHVDVNWGVRSVLFLDNYLMIGGGSGSVSFVDMRKPKGFLHSVYHKCNGIVRNTFPDMGENEIPQAVYTISSNPSKTSLFVGGGPLLVGVSGYFGTIWS